VFRPLKLLSLIAIVCALLCVPANAGATRPGTLDKRFGGDGIVLVTASKQDAPDADSMVVQSGGRPVVAAEGQLVRYLPSGDRDPTFTQSTARIRDLALGPGGTLIRVGGSSAERLLEDGRPDPSFGAGQGRVTIPEISLNSVAVQADGGIVIAGGSRGRIAVVRLLPDGALDPSFGSGGIVLSQVSEERLAPSADYAVSVALMPDGRIIVGGSAGEDEPPGCWHCWGPYLAAAVLRYLPDGSLDPSFGSGGVYRSEGEGWGSAESVVARPDGGVAFAAGQPTGVVPADDDGVGFTVVGLTPGGRLDADFARGGVSRSFLGANMEWVGPTAEALEALPGGRILTAGGQAFPVGLMIERLAADGRRTRFGGRYIVRQRFAGRRVGGRGATALALAPRRHFYVLGVAEKRVVLARFGY